MGRERGREEGESGRRGIEIQRKRDGGMDGGEEGGRAEFLFLVPPSCPPAALSRHRARVREGASGRSGTGEIGTRRRVALLAGGGLALPLGGG